MDSSTISDDEIDSIDVEKLFCDCCHQLHAKVSEKRQALDATLDNMIKNIENIENVTKTKCEEGNTNHKVKAPIFQNRTSAFLKNALGIYFK